MSHLALVPPLRDTAKFSASEIDAYQSPAGQFDSHPSIVDSWCGGVGVTEALAETEIAATAAPYCLSSSPREIAQLEAHQADASLTAIDMPRESGTWFAPYLLALFVVIELVAVAFAKAGCDARDLGMFALGGIVCATFAVVYQRTVRQ